MEVNLEKELDLLLSEDLSSVRDRERHAFDRLIEPVDNRVVLFGAGNLGRQCLTCLRRSGIEPLAFSDNNPKLWNTKVDGLEVLEPAVAARRFGLSTVFVVTIWSHGHRYEDVRRQLRSLGCSSVVPVASLRWKFSADLLPFFCSDLPHRLYEQANDCRRAYSLWLDDASRAEYLAQVRWRALGDLGALGSPVAEESYFPETIFALNSNELFVDCGAYDGDTIRSFLERTKSTFFRIYAFEPDRSNFKELCSYLTGLSPQIASRIQAHRLAVGSRRQAVRFRMTGTGASATDAGASETVECAPLDEILPDCAPSYVKMDIEGSESEALSGARHLIQRYNPVLCVCVYHRQDDLWRIPLLIHALCPRYRFFLRAHDTDGWELKCYAVPDGRLSPRWREELH